MAREKEDLQVCILRSTSRENCWISLQVKTFHAKVVPKNGAYALPSLGTVMCLMAFKTIKQE